jgi:hypothetical protein
MVKTFPAQMLPLFTTTEGSALTATCAMAGEADTQPAVLLPLTE